mgnify:CR=1 FL=1
MMYVGVRFKLHVYICSYTIPNLLAGDFIAVLLTLRFVILS